MRRFALLLLAAACAGPPVAAPPPRCKGTPCALDRLVPLLDSAISAGAAPGAVVAVSYHGSRYIYGAGRLALDDPRRPDGNTIYDLASLTKVIATTTLAMQAVSEERLDLEAPVERYLPAFRGAGKERVTIRHLLTHSGGLRADWPFLWRVAPNADSALRLINALPLDTTPGVRMVYSDLGAIVLGEVIERVLGGRLDRLGEATQVVHAQHRVGVAVLVGVLAHVGQHRGVGTTEVGELAEPEARVLLAGLDHSTRPVQQGG